jgi:hypothetical protein
MLTPLFEAKNIPANLKTTALTLSLWAPLVVARVWGLTNPKSIHLTNFWGERDREESNF